MSDSQLAAAAVLGFTTVILLIAALRVHAFVALILGSAVLGVVAGMPPLKIVDSFTAGVGSTAGSVGLVIALGAMMGGLLSDSGGADRVVDQVVSTIPAGWLPWAIGGVAALIGLPLFFEVGVVLLVPVILLVGRRIQLPLMKIGIPALAGLSVLHGLVPPHPGPVAAITTLNADMGLTLAFGLVLAVPAVILAGPVFGSFVSSRVQPKPPAALLDVQPPAVTVSVPRGDGSAGGNGSPGADGSADAVGRRTRPRFGTTVITMTMPVVLMLLRAAGEFVFPAGSSFRSALDIVGTPIVALLAGVLVAMVALGRASGLSRRQVSDSMSAALPPIAAILLIVAAGGGFKQTLVDAGVGAMVGRAAQGSGISPLVLGWLVSVGIRLATGSATVATITAAGIVAPLAARMDRSSVSLLVLAVSSGSLFFSHVNDAGFWMVKEYFGLSIGDTLKSWSVMETIISVIGLIGVLVMHSFL
ncbi:MAG TPA: gluconate:H+ symporter [Vicinamibacterales bacterium]|nr:gluconate:H+ symporter [Vicinamibacterales bacterium]